VFFIFTKRKNLKQKLMFSISSPFNTIIILQCHRDYDDPAGNHEYGHRRGGEGGKDPSGVMTPGGYYRWNDSGGECGVPFSKRFWGSGNGNGVFWYSYDYGMVHTTVISCEHDLSVGSEQYVWLETDLKHGVNSTKTPWVIVECHRPMYMLRKRTKNGRYIESELGPLLAEQNVDLYIAGHRHVYFRSCQGFNQTNCGQQGPMHVVVGTGGYPISDKKMGPCHVEDTSKHPWMESCFHSYGYGKVTVANATSLYWEFIGEGDRVLDDTWLHKNYTGTNISYASV